MNSLRLTLLACLLIVQSVFATDYYLDCGGQEILDGEGIAVRIPRGFLISKKGDKTVVCAKDGSGAIVIDYKEVSENTVTSKLGGYFPDYALVEPGKEGVAWGSATGTVYELRYKKLKSVGMLVFIQDLPEPESGKKISSDKKASTAIPRVVAVAWWRNKYKKQQLEKAFEAVLPLSEVAKKSLGNEKIYIANEEWIQKIIAEIQKPRSVRPRRYPSAGKCKKCGGKGVVEIKTFLKRGICSTCGGSGHTPQKEKTVACPNCKGNKEIDCSKCDGKRTYTYKQRKQISKKPTITPTNRWLISALLSKEIKVKEVAEEAPEVPEETEEVSGDGLNSKDIESWKKMCTALNRGRNKVKSPAAKIMSALPTFVKGTILDIAIQEPGFATAKHKKQILEHLNIALAKDNILKGAKIPEDAAELADDPKALFIKLYCGDE